MTKNITLAIDDDVLAKVRQVAASRRTSVNALVRDFLVDIAGRDDRTARARRELLALSRRSKGDIGKDWAFDRDASHER